MAKLPIGEFEASARRQFERLGFIRKRPAFVLPLDDDRFGWLGLNRASEHGVLVVHPNVGVGHRAISSLVAAHQGQSFPPVASPLPVVFAPLYQLMNGGTYRTWTVVPGEDVEPCVSDLADAVSDVAIPFMRRIVTINDFIGALERGASIDADHALPAALTLAGRVTEAADALQRGYETRARGPEAVAEQFRAFARSISPGIELAPIPAETPRFAPQRIDYSRPNARSRAR